MTKRKRWAMSDLVTDEMVEAAARAAYNSGSSGYDLWAHLTSYEEEMYLKEARAALEAAAPQIAAAALDEAAAEWREIQRTDDHLLAQWLRARADQIKKEDS